MKNLIKSILVIAGLTFSSASFAQTGMDHSTTADSTGNRNKSKMQDKMNPNRTDSTQMKDRRRTPSTMPQDSMRNRNQNDRMMQRDSVK